MSVRNLEKLFRPRSVALIGATERPGSVGALVLRNLQGAGFAGELFLVNPHHRALAGLPVYADVQSLPRVPDLAVIVTPPETVPALLAQLGARGTRAAVLITAMADDTGAPDRAWQQAVLDAAKPYLLRVAGPGCGGIMVPQIGLDASVSHIAPRTGDVAFVSQSGSIVTAMLDWATPRAIGFSHVLSLGEMADVDFGDMFDYLAADPHTAAILLYIEGVTDGRKFMSAARAAARIKPVIALKAGRSSAAALHPGIPVGSDAAYDAAFRRAGMLRVDTMAELFDALETLALTREQRGDRLAVISNGAGAGILATDALSAAGGQLASLSPETLARLDRELPRFWRGSNPIDIRDDASGARYAAAVDAVLADRGVDALLILNCPTAVASPEESEKAVIDTIAKLRPDRLFGRNIFAGWLGEQTAAAGRRRFSDARIPSYETPEAAIAGFLHRVRYQQNQALRLEAPPMRPDAFEPDVARVRMLIAEALTAGRSWLSAEEVAAVLSAYGVPLVAEGPPPQTRRPGEVELLVGIADDAVFGPVIVFGHGGTAAEVINDSVVSLPPLNLLLARAQMARTRVWNLLQAYRGKPAAALDAIAEVLIRVGQLAADHAELRELDINPLLADADGVMALAARIRVAPASIPGPARLAIAPYPTHLQTEERSRDGTLVQLRPIRPEDEPLLHDLAAHMSPEDLRLRFFAPIRGLSHTLAARLTQIDYDREMALVALHDGLVLGIGRWSADPDRERAEFAVAVRSDRKGRGVGHLLMTRLIDIAREAGIGEIVGDVLRENKAMLKMCTALGFTAAAEPADPAVMRVSKPLAPVTPA